jgi:hypothetical protein
MELSQYRVWRVAVSATVRTSGSAGRELDFNYC